MANTRISALPAGATPAGTEALVAVQSGADVRLTTLQLASAGLNQAKTYSTAATAATTSTTPVMAGLGSTLAITPATTGRVLVVLAGAFVQNTGNTTDSFQLCYGTGAAPANGAAATGTTIGPAPAIRDITSGPAGPTPLTLVGLATGLTVGTPCWFDVQYATNTGADSLVINACDVVLIEV